MIDKIKIQKRIMEIKSDERLSYSTALIAINAPLAIVQITLQTELHTLERVLGLPLTVIPIK